MVLVLSDSVIYPSLSYVCKVDHVCDLLVFKFFSVRPHCLNDQEGVIGYVNGQTEGVTCIVEAYPEPVQFSWTFANTKTLYTSVKVSYNCQNVKRYLNFCFPVDFTWLSSSRELILAVFTRKACSIIVIIIFNRQYD